MPVQIQFRRDTGSNWASANTILADGEMGINTTTNQFKIGNGSTAWNSLSYAPISGTVADIDEVTNVTITSATSGQFLKWNGTAWVNDAVPVINNIDDITGVTITAAADKDFLMYNGTAWVDSPITLGTDTTGSYVTSLVAGTGVTLANNSGEGATPTITVDTSAIQARVANVTDTEIGYLDGVTSAIQTQIDTKAPTASPTLTGVPAAPTAAALTNTTQVATTAFVRAEVAALVNSATATLDTLGEIATALGNDANLSATLTTSIGLKAPLASPTFTGTVTIPSGASISGFALLASPTFTGTPTLPTGTIATTQTAADSTTAVATTAFVTAAVAAVSVDFSSDQNILANAVFG